MKKRNRRIIVGLDLDDPSPVGEERNRALIRFAKELEQMTGIGPHPVFAAGPISETTRAKKSDRSPKDSPEQQLRGLTEGTSWSFTVLPGQPQEALANLMKDHEFPVELIVMGMRDLSILQRFHPGSITEELLRRSRRPLAILGPGIDVASESFLSPLAKPRFLVSTDLGRNSRLAEHYAVSLARKSNASITLLHNTWETIQSMEESAIQSGMVPLDFEEFVETTTRSAQNLLEKKTEFLTKRGIPCDFILDSEAHSASDSILSRENEGFSLIVLGSRGRNQLMNVFFGSTLHSTLLKSSLPIIAIRR